VRSGGTRLQRSPAAGKGEADAFDVFFLAMARFEPSEIDRARADIDRAIHWRHDHPNLPAQYLTELVALQAEAPGLSGRPKGRAARRCVRPGPAVSDSAGRTATPASGRSVDQPKAAAPRCHLMTASLRLSPVRLKTD
jgi:hypothetical protein